MLLVSHMYVIYVNINLLISRLKKHMRVHLNKKPYTCELCDWATKWSGDLSRHMSRHSGQTKFKGNVLELLLSLIQGHIENILVKSPSHVTSAILEQHEDSISEYISLICTPVKSKDRKDPDFKSMKSPFSVNFATIEVLQNKQFKDMRVHNILWTSMDQA